MNDEARSRIDRQERVAEVAALKESFAALRLCTPAALIDMRRSMSVHGQLMALSALDGEDGLEIIDGFKRIHAARELGLHRQRVQPLEVERAGAKVAMLILNASRKLSEIEEGWVVRSLYRDDGLTQPEIGRLLHHDKSWVYRRLLLVESLEEQLQADLRLGLLHASAARELARLPRGNQRDAATVVEERGLTAPQTARLVQKLLTCSDAKEREQALREAGAPAREAKPQPHSRTRAEQIVEDVAALTRIGGRLQARLMEGPLAAHGEAAAALLQQALAGLHTVLSSLDESVRRAMRGAA